MPKAKREYVRYPKTTYATIQDGLTRLMVEKSVGKNGWVVMACLCKCVYADGSFGIMGSAAMQTLVGLTRNQVMHGMEELRKKEIIMPVVRKTEAGVLQQDRSMNTHVARYRFTKAAWARIEVEGAQKASEAPKEPKVSSWAARWKQGP